MYGNPCLRAVRKSKSGERVRPGVGVFRVEFGQRRTTDALIGAIWSNAKRRQGFYVVEEYGRPVGTRTPDLYRVNAGTSSTHNNLQGCWGLPST
jgi:hypothetical protein